MTFAPITDLATLKARCLCDERTGCWHLLLAKTGQRNPDRQGSPSVYVRGRGSVTAQVLAYEIHFGLPIPPGHVVYGLCDSMDCVAAEHMSMGTKQELAKYLREKQVKKARAEFALKTPEPPRMDCGPEIQGRPFSGYPLPPSSIFELARRYA
jgi:hypothetical protein